MFNLKTFALAAALTLSAGGVALADGSALDALGSANTVSFQTLTGAQTMNLVNGAANAELVDLDSLKARIQNSPKLLGQLDSYGASLDDVIGITATDETDVKIFIQG
jgi:phage-related baseplate assembly protein